MDRLSNTLILKTINKTTLDGKYDKLDDIKYSFDGS